ncbi:hypothetical protein D9757_015365 [Collybiopsis confluens]|uniref:HAT C-terminal dimerisation domain-containing protein n=1 Tax=Collybiopsis confluens TaxID=2823264 RepID=A0A8H5CLC1_9AGAR|nr:hypothetical protein D9757_015365 [Collybiopsis confluens]
MSSRDRALRTAQQNDQNIQNNEFNKYLNEAEVILDNMSLVSWWGASLARDYLAIMASSVSSERAFSSAGITVTKTSQSAEGGYC